MPYFVTLLVFDITAQIAWVALPMHKYSKGTWIKFKRAVKSFNSAGKFLTALDKRVAYPKKGSAPAPARMSQRMYCAQHIVSMRSWFSVFPLRGFE